MDNVNSQMKNLNIQRKTEDLILKTNIIAHVHRALKTLRTKKTENEEDLLTLMVKQKIAI